MFVGVGGGAARAQALKEKVLASARDSSTYDAVTQTAFLYGEASVSYGDVTLKADRIRYDFKNEEAEAFGTLDSTGAPVGQPQFIQGGHTIGADTIRYNFRSTKAFISEVRTTESQLFALAHLSKLQPNQEVHSKGGMLTTCDRPHPHYHFAVSRMMVIPDDQIITGPAIMKLGKVPVPLAVPFGFYPNKQNGAAGVLIPVWGASEQLGTFLLNGGFYTPLSEHADLSVTGDIYSKGSWGLRARSNYRTRYRYSGNLELSRNTLLNGIPETPGYSRQDNFFVRWNHTVDPRATVNDRFSASVNFGSS
jgi:lipopolysaccharide assembly outer membrane protein LptD (OstA)